MKQVRVRFAPSPTGYLHIGGVRTALFNWLFARHEKGVFILRIEDTDRARSTPEAIQAILDGMKWIGLDWDEGPIYQTDCLAIYKEQADRLLAEGKAYLCYCTEEELDARRKEALARKALPKYDGRCRDHLNNTPRQILLYRALGYEPPLFGHLSMILGMDKVKLSKRHGATSVLEYQEAGYLPEALTNYLVRLGWSHGDQEVFSSQEMIEKFSLANITRSPAAFNPEKLLWLNGHYLKAGDAKRVAELLLPFLRKRGVLDGGAQPDSAWLEKLVVALRERAQTLVEMADKAAPFFQESVIMDQEAAKKFLTAVVRPAFARLVAALDQTSVFEHDALEQGFKSVLAETGLSMGKLAQPVRVALTGTTVSPGIFDVMVLLGRERTLARLKKAIDLMG